MLLIKKTLIIGLIIMLNPIIVMSHNPLSAAYYLEVNENLNILNIYLSQGGINKAIITKFGEEKVNAMSSDEFKQVIVDYIKENFELSVNGEEITLLSGGIKLGSHQTDLKFITSSFPNEINEMAIYIPAFKENDQHQSIFTYNLHGEADKAILSRNNNYSKEILFGEQSEKDLWSWVVLGIVMIGGGMAFFFQY